jgi:hypothetical protein
MRTVRSGVAASRGAAAPPTSIGKRTVRLHKEVPGHVNRGDFRAAESAAERFSQNARRSLSPARGLVADRLMGATMHYRGDQPKARHHLERILTHVHKPSDRPSAVWFQYDIRVMARASLAQVLCLQGFVDQARDSAQASLDGARAADHKLMLCHALAEAVCPVTLMTGI